MGEAMTDDLDTIRYVNGESLYYVLDGKNPRPATLREWDDFTSSSKKKLAQSWYQRNGKRIWVCTIFMGVNMIFEKDWFETTAFDITGGKFKSIDDCRYETYDEAMEGHKRMFRKAKIEFLGVNPEVA